MRKLFLILLSAVSAVAQVTPSAQYPWVKSQTARVATQTDAAFNQAENAHTVIQYFDGSGAVFQNVAVKASPTGKDLVSGMQSLDVLGRPDKSYLTVPSQNTQGQFVATVPDIAQSFYNDTKPFAKVDTYDPSPLSMPLKTLSPGAAFQGTTTKGVSQDYQVAGAGIRRYVISGNTIDGSGFYQNGDLIKTIVTDEDGNQVIEYKGSKSGRLLQTQQKSKNSGDLLITAYVYDFMGRLQYVIPPKVYNVATSLTVSGDVQNAIYQYVYDGRGRLVESSKPDGGASYFVYNELGQLVMSQDARQRETNLWAWVKYDGQGRKILTGTYITTATRSTLQGYFDTYTQPEQFEERSTTGGNVMGYTNRSFPTQISLAESLVKAAYYYDDYSWVNDAALNFQQYKTAQWTNAQGLSTGNKVRRLDTNVWMTSVTYYDDKNRPIQTQTRNRYGTVNQTDLVMSFAGELLEERTLYRKPSQADLVVSNHYTYDITGRKTGAYQNINGRVTPIAQYKYDEIGRLIQKNLMKTGIDSLIESTLQPSGKVDLANRYVELRPGTYTAANGTFLACVTPDALQKVDYSYNIRGALRGINLDASGNIALAAGDVFGLKLDYHETAQTYNGKINKQTWASRRVGIIESRSFTYTYDGYDRISSAAYAGVGNEDYGMPGIDYDANGNLSAFNRKGQAAPGTWNSIDILEYQYNNTVGNRLSLIRDWGNGSVGFKDVFTSTDYSYYNDGSLKTDQNKGITLIEYTYHGLPEKIHFGSTKRIENVYDAEGVKLSQKLINGTSTITTEYLGDLIYRNDSLKSILHDEGRTTVKKDSLVTSWSDTLGNHYSQTTHFLSLGYQFFLTDHLGNTRIIIQRISDTTAVVQENHYGVWGEPLTGIGKNGDWDFLFQGKEYIEGLGYDFGWRIADPFSGRWNALDPADQFRNLSGYSLLGNNPISYIDPDGRVIPVLFFIGAAVVGGGGNLWSNWSKVKNFKQGLAYFASGAVGGAVSVVNPIMGGTITATANFTTDVVTGNVPTINSTWDAAKYSGGLALDGLGAGGSGQLVKAGLPKLASYFSSNASVAISGTAGATTISTLAEGGFETMANYEWVVKPAVKGFGQSTLNQGIKQGLNRAINLNTNAAKGNFGIYEIIKDGQLYKYGKADLGRITQTSGYPTRLHQQIRKLRELYPESDIFGNVIEDLGKVTTKSAKGVENTYLNLFYKTNGYIPQGNLKSFIPR